LQKDSIIKRKVNDALKKNKKIEEIIKRAVIIGHFSPESIKKIKWNLKNRGYTDQDFVHKPELADIARLFKNSDIIFLSAEAFIFCREFISKSVIRDKQISIITDELNKISNNIDRSISIILIIHYNDYEKTPRSIMIGVDWLRQDEDENGRIFAEGAQKQALKAAGLI
jgi:hypothetical protein